ncbi:MAG: response regulator [Deltaproteobacteria bacterium]|nr:response regulator [Deltaproteobacteria bacterium]
METKRLIAADDVGVFPLELRDALVGSGFEITNIRSGAELYQRLALDRPALAIIGFQMPDLSGVEICRLVKENLSLKQIPIVMINTAPSAADRQQAFDVGCDGYFDAPVDVEAVFSRVVEAAAGSGPANRPQTFSHLTVDYRSNAEIFSVFSADPIAGGNVFMRLRRPPPVGSTVHLRVTLQGRELIDTYAEIVRSVRHEDTRPGVEAGMELRLVDVDESAQAFIQTLEGQQSFASDVADEASLDVIIQRIAEAVRTMADEQTRDPILTRIGFSPHIMKLWERSAFEALAVGSAIQNDFFNIVRAVYGLSTKIEYHLLNYRNIDLLSDAARANLGEASKENLGLATEVLQKLQEFSDQSVRAGRLEDMNNLNITRSALVEQHRKLRSAMARQSAGEAPAQEKPATDGTPQLYSDPEITKLVAGIANLFDFQSPTSTQSLASFLNIDFDLSGLNPWETAAFVEVKSRTKSLDAEFADWVRVLVAFRLRISDFIGKMSSKKIHAFEKQQEAVSTARDLFTRTEACVTLFRDVIVRTLVRKSLPVDRIRELVATVQRLLESSVSLAELHDRFSASTDPLTHRATDLAASIASVLASSDGAGIALETFSRAGVLGTGKEKGKRKWARWGGLKDKGEGRFAVLKTTRVKVMIAILVVSGAALAFMLTTNPARMVKDEKLFKSVTVADLPAIIPIVQHPRPILMGEKLGVYVSAAWLTKQKGERVEDVKKFFAAVIRKFPVVSRIAIYDSANNIRGYMEKGQAAIAYE